MREYAQAKAERDGKQADEGQATYSKAELDAMWAEVNTLKAERETLKGIVDSLKQPLEEHTAAAAELWKKKSEKRRELVSHSPDLFAYPCSSSILCMLHQGYLVTQLAILLTACKAYICICVLYSVQSGCFPSHVVMFHGSSHSRLHESTESEDYMCAG